ncbi:MAG: hypothetical protein AWU57_505 [Marinobacter sp. T13-3]|nr:MAG: hypothetical protein AWU57_505 [Marinobacter sp. T13-3]
MVHGILNGLIGLAIVLVGGFFSADMPPVARGVLLICAIVVIGREAWLDMNGRRWRIVRKQEDLQ